MRPMSRVIGGFLAVLIVAGLVTTTASGALILRLREPGMDLFAPNPDVMITPGQVITLEMWAIITDGDTGVEAPAGGLLNVSAGARSSEGGLILGETMLEPAGDHDTMFTTPPRPEDVDADGDMDAVEMYWGSPNMFMPNPGTRHLVGAVTFTADADWPKDGGETYILPTMVFTSMWYEEGPTNLNAPATVEDEGPMSGVHLVPEPATLALVGLGLALVARSKRK